MTTKQKRQRYEKNNQKEQFSSAGLILAAIGGSVGLGNMWRFPYITGQNGGGAFFCLFIICLLIVGLPVLLGELAVGRGGRGDAVVAFSKLSGQKKWGMFGFIAVLVAFFIVSYYSTIAGWTLHYAYESITASLFQHENYTQYFKHFTGAWLPLFWQVIVLILCALVIARGVSGGIEKFNKIVIPGLLIILFMMLVRTLTLDGAAQGVKYFLYPDFSKLTLESTLQALGLAFYSLSLGFGGMLTYGAYIGKQQSLPVATASIGLGSMLYALLAGLIIFPTIFTFGIKPNLGPALTFVTLPVAFKAMPYGVLFGSLFFLLLAIAALTSCVSLIEVPVAYCMRRFHVSRHKATMYVTISLCICGIPSTLAAGGVLENVRFADRNFFEWIDLIMANIMLPLGGLFITLLVGYKWKGAGEETGLSSVWKHVWLFTMRVVSPVLILFIFLSSIGVIDYFKQKIIGS